LRKHVSSLRSVVQPLLAGSKGCCVIRCRIQRVIDALWHTTALVWGGCLSGNVAEMGVRAIKFGWLVYLAVSYVTLYTTYNLSCMQHAATLLT
jgi:hypothetical protein